MYASVSTYKTHLLIKDFLDKESENIWICMVERAGSYTFLYDGTGPVARLRRAEEALIEQTLQEMAVRAHVMWQQHQRLRVLLLMPVTMPSTSVAGPIQRPPDPTTPRRGPIQWIMIIRNQ